MRRSRSHLALIRTLPCAFCGRPGPNEAAHLRMGTDGGTGLKPSDRYALPLCPAHHREQHRIGEPAFWGKSLPFVKPLAERLWNHTDDPVGARLHLNGWLMFEMGEE